MKKVFIVLYVVVLLSGCAKTIYIMPQYTNKKIEGKTLIIANLDFFIENPKDVADDLGEGNPKDVYREFFEFNFKSRMSQLSTFNYVNFGIITNSKDFPERIFNVTKKEKIYLKIPADGQVAKTDSVYGDFVLFIQNYQVYRRSANSPNQTGISGVTWKFSGGSQPDLRTTFNFVLWDNNQKQVVSYGKVDCPTKFTFAMKYETWERSITNITKEILTDTPFENFPEEEI